MAQGVPNRKDVNKKGCLPVVAISCMSPGTLQHCVPSCTQELCQQESPTGSCTPGRERLTTSPAGVASQALMHRFRAWNLRALICCSWRAITYKALTERVFKQNNPLFQNKNKTIPQVSLTPGSNECFGLQRGCLCWDPNSHGTRFPVSSRQLPSLCGQHT